MPAGGGGTFLGGYLIKRFNLPCSGILKFCLLATAACIAFTLCFSLNCPNLEFAGLTVPYQNITRFVLDHLLRNFYFVSSSRAYCARWIFNCRKVALSLENTCNSGCGCSKSQFDPICSVDGITYYSPCHAGCYRETPINNVKVSLTLLPGNKLYRVFPNLAYYSRVIGEKEI